MIGCGNRLFSHVTSLARFAELCGVDVILEPQEIQQSCETDNGGCQDICKSKSDGTVGCECRAGYELSQDLKTCTDINECTRYNGGQVENWNGGCSSLCVNQPGGYTCQCPAPDEVLGDDKQTCHKIYNGDPRGFVTSGKCIDNDDHIRELTEFSCAEILAGGACPQLDQQGLTGYCCGSCGAAPGDIEKTCDMKVDLGPGVGTQELFVWVRSLHKTQSLV